MGCFSFLCQVCGKAILSNSFQGEKVRLFLLKDGKIIERMEGEYDSYGKVFTPEQKNSLNWRLDWRDVCDLMFSEDKSNGIAAIHSRCSTTLLPTIRSEDDPNQGWGDGGELMGNVDIHQEFD